MPNVASNRAFITLFASTDCLGFGLCAEDDAVLGCGCGWVEAGGGRMMGGGAPSPMGCEVGIVNETPFPVPLPCGVSLGCGGCQLGCCVVGAFGVDAGCSTKFL